jgi:hypothetical protein
LEQKFTTSFIQVQVVKTAVTYAGDGIITAASENHGAV